MKVLVLILSICCLIGFPAFSDEDHDSHDDKKHSDGANHKNHGKEENHSEGEEHGHKEEKNESIGPGKGIVSAEEENGFQISPEAEKNFEIKRTKISILNQIAVPKSAIVTAGVETNIYRFRNGYYKRIDFHVFKKENERLYINSKELKQSDEIVISGTGLLRIAELAAFGGAPEGHSH